MIMVFAIKSDEPSMCISSLLKCLDAGKLKFLRFNIRPIKWEADREGGRSRILFDVILIPYHTAFISSFESSDNDVLSVA